MDAEARLALAQRAVARSRVAATEAIVFDERRALTRFTHEAIHQNVDAERTVVRVRAIVDGRAGVATTDALDDGALDAACERAAALARLAAAPPVPPRVAGPAELASPPGAFVEATAQAGDDARGDVAAQIFARARNGGCWSAGYVTTASNGIALATSAGAALTHDGTDAGANVKMTAADSTGFAERYDADARALDGDALGARAVEKALASAHPIDVEPGSWTVILEPTAFGELAHFLAAHFSAQTYDEGASFVSGRLGERVVGENVTIRDDYAEPLHPGMPFDWEGTPKQRVALIERGIARELVTDHTWSERLARANTGHALPAPNAIGPMPQHLVVDPGSASLDELIAQTERGLLITRLWYVRIVDQRRLILTGMTRDGTFLIERGTVTHGVRNLRFNQSLTQALESCTLGSELRRTGSYAYALVVPPIRFERFTFASGTAY